jgi:hypothetical protein
LITWEEFIKFVLIAWSLFSAIYVTYLKIDEHLHRKKLEQKSETEEEIRERVEKELQKKQVDQMADMIDEFKKYVDRRFDDILREIVLNNKMNIRIQTSLAGFVQMVKSLHKRVDKLEGTQTYNADDYDHLFIDGGEGQ